MAMKRRWRLRLPVFTSIGFLVMSAPFLSGYPGPSVHENAYAVGYVLINSIALLAVFALADPIVAVLGEGDPRVLVR